MIYKRLIFASRKKHKYFNEKFILLMASRNIIVVHYEKQAEIITLKIYVSLKITKNAKY